MSAAASSGVIKLWLYAIASVVLGAWISPLVYNAGKALAEVSSAKQTNGPLEWLAGVCRRAEFPSFFTASIVGCALVLLLPLLDSLSTSSGNGGTGQRLLRNPWELRQVGLGFLGMVALLCVVAWIFWGLGIVTWLPGAVLECGGVIKLLALSFAWATVQELWFRGLVMGVFLRAMPTLLAALLATFYFALVHFMIAPTGLTVVDADASGIGFELLGKILHQFIQPRALVVYLLPWLVIGWVLSTLRLRTASLCLPIGIHAGWLFSQTLFACYTRTASNPLWQSLAFMGAIALLGLLAHRIHPPHESAKSLV